MISFGALITAGLILDVLYCAVCKDKVHESDLRSASTPTKLKLSLNCTTTTFLISELYTLQAKKPLVSCCIYIHPVKYNLHQYIEAPTDLILRRSLQESLFNPASFTFTTQLATCHFFCSVSNGDLGLARHLHLFIPRILGC